MTNAKNELDLLEELLGLAYDGELIALRIRLKDEISKLKAEIKTFEATYDTV